MELRIATERAGIPPYPYRKVVIVADQAEVAELPCDGTDSENIVYHADLISLLHDRHPELAECSFTAGWLTQADDEAELYLALATEAMSAEDAERIREAMNDWCSAAAISRLAITDTSRRSGAEAVSDDDWNVDNWTPL